MAAVIPSDHDETWQIEEGMSCDGEELMCTRIADLDVMLRNRDAAFAASTGKAPSMADIVADPEWYELHKQLKELEKSAAVYRSGGCRHYIRRRRRFCSNAAADGLDGLCSEHFAINQGTETLSKLPIASFQGVGKRNLKRRMKRMTNPSAAQNQIPAAPQDWETVFEDPSLPLLLDIGCAKGRYLAQLAKSSEFRKVYGPHNFCGVEIFEPLVRAANDWRDKEHLRNLHYAAGNINVSFEALNLPRTLAKVCIQFPDPWQSDNLAKRVVTPLLIRSIAAALPPERGELFVVSDVPFMALDMYRIVDGSGFFELHPRHRNSLIHGTASLNGDLLASEAAILSSGMPVRPYCDIPTERDRVCDTMWRPIYRFLFQRNAAVVAHE